MKLYDLEKGIDEDNYDRVKASVMAALVNENLIDKDIANEWCKTHTIFITKRNWFCTLLDKVFDPKDGLTEYHIRVVKVVL